ERVDAVPGPPRAGGSAVIPAARAIRASVLVGEEAAADARLGLLGAREPGGDDGEPEAGFRSPRQQATARRPRHVEIADLFEPLVERHMAPPPFGSRVSRSCWSWRGLRTIAPS